MLISHSQYEQTLFFAFINSVNTFIWRKKVFQEIIKIQKDVTLKRAFY